MYQIEAQDVRASDYNNQSVVLFCLAYLQELDQKLPMENILTE